ncbi:GNAT family N-acetyltransferase [Ideonella margarita]|uniref:GNAT family N-acetyltransferase n=1 Tax=Ideonella margarita TaxID=2984191 RepID=A0ABU9C7J7_9BURK
MTDTAIPTTVLTFRDAVAADLPVLTALYETSGIDTPGFNQPSTVAAAWTRLMQQPGVRVRVAEADGQALGTLTLFVLPLLAHNGQAAALVEDVAVHPSAQGSGVGRALMDDAMALASAAGCYKLALSSNQRRTAAHAFYEHLGFERHGVSFVVPLQETSDAA